MANGNGNGRNGHYTAQQFIDAIPGTAGIVTTIAKRVGCEWHTAKKYIFGYPTIKQAYDDECERVLDAAESAVIQAITPGQDKDPDLPTAKWYLTMKGAGRGYAQRHQVEMGEPGAFDPAEWNRKAQERLQHVTSLGDSECASQDTESPICD